MKLLKVKKYFKNVGYISTVIENVNNINSFSEEKLLRLNKKTKNTFLLSTGKEKEVKILIRRESFKFYCLQVFHEDGKLYWIPSNQVEDI